MKLKDIKLKKGYEDIAAFLCFILGILVGSLIVLLLVICLF